MVRVSLYSTAKNTTVRSSPEGFPTVAKFLVTVFKEGREWKVKEWKRSQQQFTDYSLDSRYSLCPQRYRDLQSALVSAIFRSKLLSIEGDTVDLLVKGSHTQKFLTLTGYPKMYGTMAAGPGECLGCLDVLQIMGPS